MSEVKTLVYCDLEATGLKSSGRPRITELSLVAVNTENILELSQKLRTRHPKNNIEVESLLPRVMNKLTVCLYPMATIRPEVSDITGLDNYNLSGQATFNMKTGELLHSYLSHLPAPICLVAHNGDVYDFPLLKAELEKAGITLPSDMLCADSYVGMKEIFRRREEAKHSKNENIGNAVESQVVNEIAEVHNDQKHIKNNNKECRDLESENSKTPTKGLSFSGFGFKRYNHDSINSIKVSKSMKFTQRDIGLTPTNNTTRLNDHKWRTKRQNSDIFRSKKKLNFDYLESPTSYSLINLHKQLLGYTPAQSHGAEADCLTLLKTTAVLGREWVEWVQVNCYPFSKCKRMWSIQKS